MTKARWEDARQAIGDGPLVPDVTRARVVGSLATPSWNPTTLLPRANE
jgi:hypothetical protein